MDLSLPYTVLFNKPILYQLWLFEMKFSSFKIPCLLCKYIDNITLDDIFLYIEILIHFPLSNPLYPIPKVLNIMVFNTHCPYYLHSYQMWLKIRYRATWFHVLPHWTPLICIVYCSRRSFKPSKEKLVDGSYVEGYWEEYTYF